MSEKICATAGWAACQQRHRQENEKNDERLAKFWWWPENNVVELFNSTLSSRRISLRSEWNVPRLFSLRERAEQSLSIICTAMSAAPRWIFELIHRREGENRFALRGSRKMRSKSEFHKNSGPQVNQFKDKKRFKCEINFFARKLWDFPRLSNKRSFHPRRCTVTMRWQNKHSIFQCDSSMASSLVHCWVHWI